MGLRTWLGLKSPRPLPITRAENIGQAYFQNCRVLADRIELLKQIPSGGVAAEIGVATGDYSQAILNHNRPSKLLLIDAWDSERYASGFPAVQAKFANEIANGTIEIHRGRSVDVLPTLPGNSLDWAYIDTTHQYDDTLSELRLCASLVKSDGRIAGHDFCTRGTYGVIPAVFKFCVEAGWRFEYITIDGNGSFSFCLQRSTA